jgi:hypothetical protein
MIKDEKSALAEYLSLFTMISLTVIALVNKNVSVFYIIYLFWWDEILKSVFDVLKYWFKKHRIKNQKEYLSNTTGRLFFLMIYIVFIIVFFGFMIDWKNPDLMGLNFEVLFFRNVFFNFSFLSFLLREIYLYIMDDQEINPHGVLSRGIITLHISIILGVLMWAFITLKLKSLQAYAMIFAIIPFLLFKIYFEILEIKNNAKQRIKNKGY